VAGDDRKETKESDKKKSGVLGRAITVRAHAWKGKKVRQEKKKCEKSSGPKPEEHNPYPRGKWGRVEGTLVVQPEEKPDKKKNGLNGDQVDKRGRNMIGEEKLKRRAERPACGK